MAKDKFLRASFYFVVELPIPLVVLPKQLILVKRLILALLDKMKGIPYRARRDFLEPSEPELAQALREHQTH